MITFAFKFDISPCVIAEALACTEILDLNGSYSALHKKICIPCAEIRADALLVLEAGTARTVFAAVQSAVMIICVIGSNIIVECKTYLKVAVIRLDVVLLDLFDLLYE